VSSRRATLIALVGVGAWLAVAFLRWLAAPPLGHDESQYAIAARDWLAGDPPRWFYLSRGMTVVAAPGIWLGGSELVLRLTPMVLGVGFVLATYLVGRRSVGATSAAWALLVLASSRNVVRWSTDLLSDIPAAALLLAGFAVLLDEVDREDGPRWRVILAAPLLATALYVRYGSAVYIAVIVTASLAVGARTLVRRPLPVIATAGLFLVLLVPHFMQAQAKLGSPLGILLASRAVPQQEHLADGLLTYLTSNPFRYYGTLTPFALVAGLLALRVRDRRRLLTWIVGVGSLVAMGLTTHGMLRYILLPVALLVLLGTDQIIRWLALVPRTPRRVVSALIITALATVWLLLLRRQPHADDYRHHRMRGTLTAVDVITRDAAGAACVVVGYHYTQLEWYSRCRAPLVLDEHAVTAGHERGAKVYVVRDHTPAWVEKWNPELARMPGVPNILFVNPDVEVARFDPR
jgi:4-amino-4-deoxy-L-arabinose transferase-like glycosyltransferase